MNDWLMAYLGIENNKNKCERCGVKAEYSISPEWSKVCSNCADYLLGVNK